MLHERSLLHICPANLQDKYSVLSLLVPKSLASSASDCHLPHPVLKDSTIPPTPPVYIPFEEIYQIVVAMYLSLPYIRKTHENRSRTNRMESFFDYFGSPRTSLPYFLVMTWVSPVIASLP